jgi:hypothetical protein
MPYFSPKNNRNRSPTIKFGTNNFGTQVLICAGLAIVAVMASPDRQTPPSTDANGKSTVTCSSIPSSKPFTRTDLFFGLRKPNGTEVNNIEFQRFLDREVTPRFPDGFTVVAGNGQFKNARGAILKERSQQLILLYPVAAISSQQIEQIRKAYTIAFQQQSVLRADELTCAAF